MAAEGIYRKISGNYNLAAELGSNILPIQDIYLECDTTLVACNIQLPEISALIGFFNNKIYVNDLSGNAGTNNINILIAGSDKINNAVSQAITINGLSAKLEIVGTTDWLYTTGPGAAATVGALGGFNTSSNNLGFNYTVHPVGIRSLKDGTVKDTFAVGTSYGTQVGAFDPVTGIWTCPVTGYYDFTTLFSLTPDADFNAVSGPANLNGFISAGVNSQDTGVTPVIDFNDFIGMFQVGITDTTGGIIVCTNKELVFYDTSQIAISAGYNGRLVTLGTQLVCRWLNKCKNPVVGQAGNSFHFSATHIK